MFEQIQPAPPDPILGLTEAFKKDERPGKINLGVGVYKDANGTTPILKCVKEAERRLLEQEKSKSYLPIDGAPQYGELVRQLLWGPQHEVVTSGRAVTLHTPGGTGALRVAADFIHKMFPSARIWCSKPTWANHPGVFQEAGIQVESYPYLNAETHQLDLEAMLSALQQASPGDVVCLHACCHNPTGIDPTPQQWEKIADVIYQRGLLPLVDFAYQGFAYGLEEDATGLRILTRPGKELLVASSFSKNFGLYCERVGALTLVASDAQVAQAALSQLKICVRRNYSNPPFHGGAIVMTVLQDAELRQLWEQEVADMRNRINRMRELFADTMAKKTSARDFSFIKQQRGMFSMSGLTPEQVDRLREEHAIYIVRSGRINVAGMTEESMERLCDAVASVL